MRRWDSSWFPLRPAQRIVAVVQPDYSKNAVNDSICPNSMHHIDRQYLCWIGGINIMPTRSGQYPYTS